VKEKNHGRTTNSPNQYFWGQYYHLAKLAMTVHRKERFSQIWLPAKCKRVLFLFLTGEFSPNFHLKNMISNYTKKILMGNSF
jgi:hypothetical protein